MTIAIAILINDGMVMAADSATTLTDPAGLVLNVYPSANKIFNLHKGLPIGGYTYGAGSIGDASISTLAKDLRVALEAGVPIGKGGWVFDRNTYTIEQVAIAARQFLFEDRYNAVYAAATPKPPFGFNVGGYSAGCALPELWEIIVDDTGSCGPPQASRPRGQYGISWRGEPEAIHRLVVGFGTGMPPVLASLGIAPSDIPKSMLAMQTQLEIALAPPAMPIMDAIELADYLVSLTVNFSKFKYGAPTVGGPVAIAAITKHEGFKWVKRKHYYDTTLNPT